MSQPNYRIVTRDKETGLWGTANIFGREAFEKFIADSGMKITGDNYSPRQRAELQGQPVVNALIGPMWDGDAVRYENQEAYNRLSA